MNRTKFFQIVTVDDVPQFDYLDNNLSAFQLSASPALYRVEDDDLLRPDLISYKNYGTVEYWWIILLINKILDPFNEIVVGDILKIPNIVDIYSFIKRYKKR